ncbi:MAG: porphobilinogen synthase [Chlorobiota bacterium]|jgi:porphobilinogen synthase|nr:porphobilinogen synthase [Chlorobiota bacterium]QQS66798.1 MAG: porphobilinogen synthase [Chlorobiota bacterium]
MNPDIFSRPRRLRRTPQIRDLVRETTLNKNNFVYPLFVVPGKKFRREISSMPNVFQLSIDEVVRECAELLDLGINSVILFGIPEEKDEAGSGAYNGHGIVQEAIRAIKRELPEMLVITDVCLCEYTSHGHCGILNGDEILNDPTVELLSRIALSHAESGADIIAPSDMMDGRVGAIRETLDDNGFDDISIMSYAVKYSSAFYGPFRDAAESTPKFGDRKTHQMDYSNSREAIKEAALDITEGADILMVKPAMPSLDIIKSLYEITNLPIAAYQVSGEYSMIHAASQNGWIDLEKAMLESLTVIKRAGASIIISYFAKDIALKL